MCLGRTKEASEEERTFHGASEGGGEERVKKSALGASEGAGKRARGVGVAFDAVKRRLVCVTYSHNKLRHAEGASAVSTWRLRMGSQVMHCPDHLAPLNDTILTDSHALS